MATLLITVVGVALGVLTALSDWPHRPASVWAARVAGTVAFAAAMVGVIIFFPSDAYLGSVLGGAMFVSFILVDGVVIASHPLMIGRPYWERVWWGLTHASYLRQTRTAGSEPAGVDR